MQKLSLLLVVAALGGCAAQSANESDLAGGAASSGKADYGYEIVFGKYTNKNTPEVGELVRLELSAGTELPEGCEGLYTLTEQTARGPKDASGCYHTYRYRDDLFIKFLDAQGRETTTSAEKYSWVYWDDTLVMSQPGTEDEFFMELPLVGTDLRCTATRIYDDNVFEEGLSTDEYPDVSIEQNPVRDTIEVGIGAASYEKGEDNVTFAIADGKATAVITQEDGSKITVTGPANASGSGRIDITERGRTRRVAALRCTGRTAAPTASNVTCTMRRRGSTGGPPGEITATMPLSAGSDDAVQSNDGIAAFEANYSFDIANYDGTLQILFYENLHVQDETGELSCDTAGVAPGARFCEDTIDVDKYLGTGDDRNEDVTAFDFWCALN